MIANPSAAATLWINPVGGTATVNASGSIEIAAGQNLLLKGPSPGSLPSTISIVASASATPYTCAYQ